MRFSTESEAVTYIFQSLAQLRGVNRGFDEDTRTLAPTRHLIQRRSLLDTPREYTVVTGSKGKGSTTAITSRVLQSLGHTVGMISSPHLISYRERIRINGRSIPLDDFLRILDELAPDIDDINSQITPGQYFSPQGIFLAIALRWFDEQQVNAAVLEVGRGGRYDDIALVPNRLSLFTPIMLEHTNYLGPTLARIAWHKAGIIKPYGYALSGPQATEALNVLQAEADTANATFNWIAPMDMGEYLGPAGNGIHMRLGRYGDLDLSLMGRYQVANATLAVWGAGNVHARLAGISHGSPEYVERVRHGLANVNWPGRCHQLQDSPAVYIDAAINAESAALYLESVRDRLTTPTVGIVAVPSDKDYAGVYSTLGPACDTLIVTETARNVSLKFPSPQHATALAGRFNGDARYAPTLNAAMQIALERAGSAGTVLIAGTISLLSDAMHRWEFSFETL